MKELSRFKVLSITLLMTVSSCVAGTVDLHAEILRTYGFEFDISLAEKTQGTQRNKKSKNQIQKSKYFLNQIVKTTGIQHMSFQGLTLDYSPVKLQLTALHFTIPLINKKVELCNYIYKETYSGVDLLNRAGPFYFL
jgi:hypothetical protein